MIEFSTSAARLQRPIARTKRSEDMIHRLHRLHRFSASLMSDCFCYNAVKGDLMNKTIRVILVVFLASVAAVGQIRKLTLDMYWDMETVADPQISPDGKQIVYTRGWT